MSCDSNDASRCRVGSDIPMPAGTRYAGQPADTSSRPSIVIDGPEGRNGFEPHETHAVVDYFYHAGSYWRAVIPLDGIDQVFGQAFNFSKPRTRRGDNGREIVFDKDGLPRRRIPILNHVQSRFELKSDQPVELFPLECPDFGAPVHQIHDVIYSLEAVGPAGVVFNVPDGLAGNLLTAHRFLSAQEMVFERIVVENQHVTESPPLPLQEHERRGLLEGSLLRSHQAGTSERYYLYRTCRTNNCTSSPFQIVDSVVSYRWPHRLGASLYRLPLSPRFYLRARGLDADPSFRKLVRSDFAEYIEDAATQQRKRDRVRQLIRIRRRARAERR